MQSSDRTGMQSATRFVGRTMSQSDVETVFAYWTYRLAKVLVHASN